MRSEVDPLKKLVVYLFGTDFRAIDDRIQKWIDGTSGGQDKPSARVRSDKSDYRLEIVWSNVVLFIILHTMALYGLYLFLFVAPWKTVIWTIFLMAVGGEGIAVGAHRLWAHRAYKANLALRIILMIGQTVALQNHLYEWVRDHRVHHKFSDTNADPHNASRGFFFSHIGWLMVKKHPDVINKGKTIDMSDVEADPVVRFQRRIYIYLVVLFCFVVPTIIPWYFWNEDLLTAFFASAIFRLMYTLNVTWLINSAAHIWGTKPYDKAINPGENPLVAFLVVGEGWHNYHHVFPWDYRTAELGNFKFNLSATMIDFFHSLGWAYDLKTVSEDLIRRRMKRTGDGTKIPNEGRKDQEDQAKVIWGWGDPDMEKEDVQDVQVKQ